MGSSEDVTKLNPIFSAWLAPARHVSHGNSGVERQRRKKTSPKMPKIAKQGPPKCSVLSRPSKDLPGNSLPGKESSEGPQGYQEGTRGACSRLLQPPHMGSFKTRGTRNDSDASGNGSGPPPRAPTTASGLQHTAGALQVLGPLCRSSEQLEKPSNVDFNGLALIFALKKKD